MGTRYLLLICRVVGGTTHGQRIQKKVAAGECLGVSRDAYFRDMMIVGRREQHSRLATLTTHSLTHSFTHFYYEIS